MSLLSRLFGGSPKQPPAAAEPESYQGFLIHPEPIKEPAGHRVAARIEKEIAGTLKSHHLVRADVCSALDEAVRLSLLKSRQMIDQQGDRLFE